MMEAIEANGTFPNYHIELFIYECDKTGHLIEAENLLQAQQLADCDHCYSRCTGPRTFTRRRSE